MVIRTEFINGIDGGVGKIPTANKLEGLIFVQDRP
jgi:hypothetical protein